MAYRALYRIYRPTSFDEVAGQDHITDVLRNQVKLGHLSHAYLFCGPRGTGKTTMAKILSRAANCCAPVNGEPCGTCEMCKISAGVNADIMEIDAASNNGVDNVRELIDQAQFAPLQLRKRVFIIDEVHMLSQNAFNALLKTLEEPPEHVLFILATTEPEKLLATVISRCQRFDFKRLTMQNIVNYMGSVLKKEKIEAEIDALRSIAHAANGGMRDALSLLNQCISVSGNRLTSNIVREVLGSVEADLLFSLADNIFMGDGNACIQILDTVVRAGRDLGVLASDLSEHMRSLLLTNVCGKCPDLLEITEDAAQRYEKQAKSVSRERLLYYCEELIKTRISIKSFPNPRLLMETTLLRISFPMGEKSEEAILSRIAALEDNAAHFQHNESANIDHRYSDIRPMDISIQNREPLVLENRDYSSKEASLNTNNYRSAEVGDYHTNTDTTAIPEYSSNVLPSSTASSLEPSFNEPESIDASVQMVSDTSCQLEEDPNTRVIYEHFSENFARVNPLTVKMLNIFSKKKVVEDKLILYYDSTEKENISLLLSGSTATQLQQAAEHTKPGLKVLLRERKNDEADPHKDGKYLQELFGDILTIE